MTSSISIRFHRKLTWLVRRMSAKRVATVVGLLLIAQCVLVASAEAQTCVSITANGGNGNGTTDNTAAFSATLALLTAQGGCISFPAGKYLFNSALTLNYPAGVYSLTIVGAGSDSTVLYFTNSNGIVINAQNTGTAGLQSLHVRDVTFTTGQAGSYSALTVSKPGYLATFPQSEIVRTTFRGDDGAAMTDYWAVGVALLGVSNFNFDSDLFYGNSAGNGGTGIAVSGCSAGTSDETYDSTHCTPGQSGDVREHASGDVTPGTARIASVAIIDRNSRAVGARQLMSEENRSTARKINSVEVGCTCTIPPPSPFGVVYNIAKSGFYNLGSGITVGTLIQGVTVTQSNFANGVTGIFVAPDAYGIAELTISGSFFNATGNQIVTQGAVASVIMNGNLINVKPNSAGLWLDRWGGDQNSLVNNVFSGTNTTGPSGTGIMINYTDTDPAHLIAWSQASGNVFTNLSVGFDLTKAVSWNVQANAYDAAVPTQVYNPAGSANSVGVASN